jgi:general secretion pathway protein D
VADTDTNSLVVTTSSANWPRVQAIIADLDRAVPQVLIKVLIAEVTHDRTLDLGVEFSGMNLRASGKGFTTGTDFGVQAVQSAAVPGGGGFVFRLDEKNVSAAVRALAGVAKIDVLSRPYILTSDNQQAAIFIGQEVPYITESRTTDTGQTINNIDWRELGIGLQVTPHINPMGLVTLDVYPEVSSLTDSTVPISDTVKAPIFSKRYAQSRVAILDGETIVIGGLMQDNITKSIQKVPGLGDIPWIGALFQSTTQKKTKTELIIFLTPHVAIQPEDLKTMSEDEKGGLRAVPGAVEPGAFQEHMRGMERGASTRPAVDRPQVDVHIFGEPGDAGAAQSPSDESRQPMQEPSLDPMPMPAPTPGPEE